MYQSSPNIILATYLILPPPDQIICARPAASSKRMIDVITFKATECAQKILTWGQATNPMNMAVS